MMSNVTKNFNILATSLNIQYNYFNDSIKLVSDLYVGKFLNQQSFPCTSHIKIVLVIKFNNNNA